MATRDDVKNILAYMALAFPNYHPDVTSAPVNSVDVYRDLLGDLPADTLKTATQACCAQPGRQFAPSAGEIRGMAVQLHAQAAGLPSAGEAWAAVIGSFERMPAGNMAGGGHDNPILDLPLVVETVRQMGGYASIDYDNQMAERAHFLKIYQAAYDRELTSAAQLPATQQYIEAHRQIAGQVGGLVKKLSAHTRTGTGAQDGDALTIPTKFEIADQDEIMRQERRAAFDTGERKMR